MEGLSEHDKAVINTIFDPNQKSALSDTLSNGKDDKGREDEVREENLAPQVLELVKRAISRVEENNFEESFRLFNEALKQAPNSPSVLNDRAQALRLAGRNEEALEDLHLAVKLSQGKGKAGIQALCQRGILYNCMKMDCEAKEDFKLAAKGGSDFASAQLIALDPYAAMGNAVLQEITENL